MPVPWEALIPFGVVSTGSIQQLESLISYQGLLTAMFGVAGTLMNISQRAQNDGKPPRFKLNKWEDAMMERDYRLTGSKRGQSTNPVRVGID